LVKNYFTHPLLRHETINYRQYQEDIVNRALYKNSLIVIPTSLGKTIVALLVCLDILLNWKKAKILVLAPTRPLVFQHFELFKMNTLLSNQCIALTGKIAPEIRKTIWKSSSIRVYFATPELVKNDIRDSILEKDEFYLIVFDEAHRAVKDYSYTSISKQFYKNSDHAKLPLVLGLSASPGAKEEKIKEICSNLFIEQIIVKSERDDDVLPYVFDTNIEHCSIEMNDYHKDLSTLLNSMIFDNISWLINKRLIKKKRVESVYRKDLLSLGEYIKLNLDPKNMNFFLLTALKFQSLSLILLYCRDLVESQGSFALKKFLDNAKENSESKTYQELFADPRIKEIIKILKDHDNEPPPKLEKVLSVVNRFLDLREDIKRPKNFFQDTDDDTINVTTTTTTKQNSNSGYSDKQIPTNYQKKILIFSQYRDTLEVITTFLNDNGIPCKGFYGQSNKNGQKGLSQDKQLSILGDFRLGKFPVLVATSVAEEGLNIPNVDLVLFYEPVPSEIRFIQRKGRTGRFSNGKVVILISENSIDTKYLEISKRKVNRMKSSLQNTNFTLEKYDKRTFENPDKMLESELLVLYERSKKYSEIGKEDNYNENINPILDSISSNSNKKIKGLVKQLSYRHRISNDSELSASFTRKNLEDLYEISLNLDRKKIVERVQRKIHDLLGKAGKSGLEVSYLNEVIGVDKEIIRKAIENLTKMKRTVWVNKNTVALIESIKFLSGSKYSISIERIVRGKAIVLVNEKWYADLEHQDYFGPRALLKKGNTFSIIGEMYRSAGRLHLIIKKII
jgi:ERCC4-related helicase